MAFEQNGPAPLPWQSALAIAPNLFVMHDGTNGKKNVKLATTGAQILGITVGKTDQADDNVAVRSGYGQAYLTVNGNSSNISATDLLKAVTGGIGVNQVADDEEYGAIALEAATADGVKILVEVRTGQSSGSADD